MGGGILSMLVVVSNAAVCKLVVPKGSTGCKKAGEAGPEAQKT